MHLRCFCLLSVFSFTVYGSSAQRQISDSSNALSLLDTVYSKIMRLYVEKKDPAKLMRKGIEAALSSLDPYSAYLTADEAREFNTLVSGKFGGLGLTMKSVDGQIMVGEVFKGYPADNGRKVTDHDGVSPDFQLSESPFASITRELTENQASNDFVFRFAVDYRSQHPAIAPAASFTLSDAEYNQFVDFLRDKNFSYTTPSDKKITELKNAALQDGYWDGILPAFAAMQAQIKKEKENDLIRFKDQVKELLEEEIVLQSDYQWGRIEKSLKNDPEVRKAEEIFANGNLYVQTLGNRN